jgi:hypothetical protein
MHSDLQWIVIQLLLCSCTVVVNVDVTGCIGFIQKFKKKEEFGAFYTLFGKLRDDANRFLNYFRISVSSFDEIHRRLVESLQRRNSKVRNCIQPVEMLAVEIR